MSDSENLGNNARLPMRKSGDFSGTCGACGVLCGGDSQQQPPIIGATRCRTITAAEGVNAGADVRAFGGAAVGMRTYGIVVSLCYACYRKALAAVGVDLDALIQHVQDHVGDPQPVATDRSRPNLTLVP